MEQQNHHKPPTDSILTRWSRKLQERWGVSANRVFIILVVFAFTGITVLLLKRPVVDFFAGENNPALLFSILYYILILPIYNLILLFYGFLFGQFKFFWNFEKKMIDRISKQFRSKK